MKPALKIRKVVNGSLLLKMRDWKHQWMPILELQLKSLQKSWVPVSDQFLNIWTKLLSLRSWRDGYHTIWIKTQNTRHYEVCSAPHLRKKKKEDLFLLRTCDTKWILYGNWQRSRQSLNRKETPKEFPKPKFYQNKVMVIVWWNRWEALPRKRSKCIGNVRICNEY